MPTKVQIDGVGTVELDDSFANLSHDQQEATIQEIAASAKGQGEGHYTGPPISQDSDFTPDEPGQLQPNTGADSTPPPPATPEGYQPGAAARHLHAADDGVWSTLGAPVDVMAAGMRKVGVPVGDDPILGSKNLKEMYQGGANWLTNKMGLGEAVLADQAYAPKSALERYTQSAARGIGANAVPLGGMLSAGSRMAASGTPALLDNGSSLMTAGGQALKKIAMEASKRPGLAVAAETAAGAGAGIGGQAGSDLTGGSPIGEFAGSMLGGLAGGIGVGPLSKSPTTRFVENQVAKNPYAAYDAEIAQDMAGLTTNTARSPLDPKGRAVVTAKSVNNLEQGYQSRFKDMINGLDLPQADKLKLKQALDQDYTGSMPDVEALRGTPAGDAVAGAIIKTQRLRALTPELRGNVLARAAKAVIPATLVGGGAATFGAGGALVGTVLSRVGRGLVDGEAARVNAAERLVKRAPAYAKLAEQVGPSGARDSKQALEDLYAQTVGDKEAAANAPVEPTIPKPPKSASAAMMKLQQMDTSEPPVTITPAPKSAQRAMMKLQQMDTSEPPPKPARPLPAEQQAIEDNIDAGIPGTSNVQNAFADQVGAPVPDMLRALDGIAERYPGMAGEIRRIKAGYPTMKSRGIAPALVPAMKQFLTEDGTLAKLQQAGEEAATRANARKALETPTEAPTAPPAVSTANPVSDPNGGMTPEEISQAKAAIDANKASGSPSPISVEIGGVEPKSAAPSERVMRPVDRPKQWDAAAKRYTEQADRAIDDFRADASIPDQAYRAMPKVAEKIRDNFKTRDAAVAWFDTDVAPDLEMSGLTQNEISKVRSHIYRIADTKPYKTQAELEAGTAARSRGRPKKAKQD